MKGIGFIEGTKGHKKGLAATAASPWHHHKNISSC
jgi:hypothetical protein